MRTKILSIGLAAAVAFLAMAACTDQQPLAPKVATRPAAMITPPGGCRLILLCPPPPPDPVVQISGGAYFTCARCRSCLRHHLERSGVLLGRRILWRARDTRAVLTVGCRSDSGVRRVVRRGTDSVHGDQRRLELDVRHGGGRRLLLGPRDESEWLLDSEQALGAQRLQRDHGRVRARLRVGHPRASDWKQPRLL